MFGVVPKTLWSVRAPADERNRIRLGLRPLLVRTGGANILIDAGVGDKLPPKLQAIYGLSRERHLDHAIADAGLSASDIDVVIATHLHFDHAGGFTTRVGVRVVPRFPRARYVIRRGEWTDAIQPNSRSRASYMPENFGPLLESGVLDFIDDDGDVVPGISVERTGGHTAHHQIVRIVSEGRTAVFAADLLPTTAHLDEAWIMAYDLYPMESLLAKRRFLAEAVAHEYVIFFEHDPAMAAGVIRSDGKRLVAEPIA
jgi:glyoxylase-like metal-dependent hydrolase (beta-lactamase superfamily II)